MKFKKYPLICINCNKQFHGDKPNRKYCSSICAGNAKKPKLKLVCLYCGNIFRVPRFRTNAKWCSRECYDSYRQIIKQAHPSLVTPNTELPSLNLPKPPKKLKIKRNSPLTKKNCIRCDADITYTPKRKYCDICNSSIIREQSAARRRKKGIPKKQSVSGYHNINNNAPCEICGWQETTCDRHHIIPKKYGGTDSEDNIIVLCPNHHRMADFGIIQADELYKYKI